MSTAFIQLNEINFDIVSKYIQKGYRLNQLEKVILQGIDTFENESYKNLEPWIQWVTIFRGKPYKKHKVFRLGDGYNKYETNIFCDLNRQFNLSIGALAPMNVGNNDLPFDFFLPDPWSTERIKGPKRLSLISNAIKQGVNDNSGKGLELINKIKLVIGLITLLNIQDLKKLFIYYKSIKDKHYRRAIFLDYMLVLIHITLIRKFKTDFSTVFLNAGAHIQHHYFLNSEVLDTTSTNPAWYIDNKLDPLKEVLRVYDELLSIYDRCGIKIILMNGLQQLPYTKPIYYYRLKNHSRFLKSLGISFKEVIPKMTRDFEILCTSNNQRKEIYDMLKKFKSNDKEIIFNKIELRDKSLFCTLTYSKEIKKEDIFYLNEKKFKLYNEVNFVAIKNGIHDKHGKLFISDIDLKKRYQEAIPLSSVRDLIMREMKVN